MLIPMAIRSLLLLAFSPEFRTENSVNYRVEGGVEIAQPQKEAERTMSRK